MHGLDHCGRCMERCSEIAMTRFAWLDKFTFYSLLMTLFIMPFSISLNGICMGLAILSWIMLVIVRKEKIQVPPLGWFFIFFLFVAIVSAAASDYQFQALRGVGDVSRYTAVFFISITVVKSNERARQLVWALILSTGLWVILGTIHQFLIVKVTPFGLLKFFSLGNKNSIGQYAQMMISIIIGLLVNKSLGSKNQRFLLVSALLCGFGLFVSSSKTMWIAFILTLGIFTLLKKSRRIFLWFGCTLLIFMAAAVWSDRVRTMTLHIGQSIRAPSMQERYIVWKQSYLMFRNNPIWGVGPKCFFDAREKYQVPSSFGQAHNMIIHTACEMGIVGVASLISWIAFYIYFIATYRKKVSDPFYLGLWFGGVGYLVTLAIGGITEPTIGGEHSQLFMALIGLMHVGLRSNAEENQRGWDSRGAMMRNGENRPDRGSPAAFCF